MSSVIKANENTCQLNKVFSNLTSTLPKLCPDNRYLMSKISLFDFTIQGTTLFHLSGISLTGIEQNHSGT
jgi:hypothetical protein